MPADTRWRVERSASAWSTGILPTDDQAVTPEILAQTRTIIEQRVNATGVAEPNVQTQDGDRITVELPGVTDVDEVRRLIGATGQLDFVGVPDRVRGRRRRGRAAPRGHRSRRPSSAATRSPPPVPGTDQLGQPTVDIELGGRRAPTCSTTTPPPTTASASRSSWTASCSWRQPSTPLSFDGRAQISGSFTTRRDEQPRDPPEVRPPAAGHREVSVDDPGDRPVRPLRRSR